MKSKIQITALGIAPTPQLYSCFGPDQDHYQLYKPQQLLPNFNINLLNKSPQQAEFAISGLDPPLLNALRRVALSEVPTMAIHNVMFFQNTSVMPDQVLAHRLGLIPIKADAEDFKYREEKEELNGGNSIKFKLKAHCTRKPQYLKLTDREIELSKIRPEEYLNDHLVTASHLLWEPMDGQATRLAAEPSVVHPDLPIIKLAEGQELQMDLYCIKGIGKMHAKWSPVSTVYYKLTPYVKIKGSVKGSRAKQLVQSCPMKVFDLQGEKAKVRREQNCTACRNCVQKFQEVELGKRAENYVLTVQSTGIYEPVDIMVRAADILEKKASSYQKA